MPYVLRKNLRFCVVGDSTVFLDLKSGRYSALAGPYVPSFGRWVLGAPLSAADFRVLNRLAEQGFLVVAAQGDDHPIVTAAASPETGLDTRGHRPTVLSLTAAFAIRLLWSWRVRHWSIERLIRRIGPVRRKEVAASSPASMAMLKRTVRSFELVDVILGSHDHCLARSLALAAACRKRNLDSTLIIGIRAAPFAAHSWVQQEGLVLNEKPDQAQLFTPILVA